MSSSPKIIGPLSRFCDYFVICGLDYNSGLEILQSYETDENSESSNCPLERSYKPKVLAHYPEDVPWNTFDQDAVRNLSLPSGLVFRTQKQQLEPCFHSFVIIRKNGSKTFGFSYVFFEEVKSNHVSTAIHTLQAMYLTELSSAKHYNKQRATQSKNIRNAAANMYSQQHQPKSSSRAAYLSIEGNNTRSLPRHFKLASHKQSLNSLSFYDVSKDNLYVTKSISIICPLPFLYAAKHFLTNLYKASYSENENFSLESYVYHLLYYVPLPPLGQSIKFNCFEEWITCSRPRANDLPLLDYNIGELFKLLDLESILQLFTCILLENQVLLYSKDLYKLMLVAECTTELLFPFIWQHVYVPILPSSLYHFLDAPVPYYMGIQNTEFKDVSCEANVCFVDIDNNIVNVPEDLPTFPHKTQLLQELSHVLKKFNVPVGNLNNIGNVNNRNSPYRTRRVRGRKNSWAHDSDSGMSSNEEPTSQNESQLNISPTNNFISQHSSVNDKSFDQKSTDIIFHNKSISNIKKLEDSNSKNETYLKNLKLNNSIREIFFNRFVQMFASYHHFLIQPEQESTHLLIHYFDKATFLSDQPAQHLPFLSRFIETQMFASFIDRKVTSISSGELDPNLTIFEKRIKALGNRYEDSLVRSSSYEPCITIKETEQILVKRYMNPQFTSPQIYEISNEKSSQEKDRDFRFPILNANTLNTSPTDIRNLKIMKDGCSSDVIIPEASIQPTTSEFSYITNRNVFQPQTSSSPASIASQNLEFVKQLLQECKMKTKILTLTKMKMGPEANSLGHGEISIVDVEENTLVASLCDLLERIWTHGLHIKKGKGKSPLWNFLVNFQESEACKDSKQHGDQNLTTYPLPNDNKSRNEVVSNRIPDFLHKVKSRDLSLIKSYLTKAKIDLSAMAMELNLSMTTTPDTKPKETRRSPEKRDRRVKSAPSSDIPTLKALPHTIAFDMRNIQAISEIKTEIGYARAWIRLSLEKKVLSKHLKHLLSDDELLRGFYKRTAFLRSEEEREQFLFHLLTLNAVDYYCFTNTYTNIVLPYRVLIFPSKRFNVSTTSANVWISVSGTLGETGTISVPKNSLEFIFKHKNIGHLTTLNIGHDNFGVSPKWSLDCVLIRNELTGQCTKFPCGRWLGRDVDDGSTERLLVGESYCSDEEISTESRIKPSHRARSPSVPRRGGVTEVRLNIPDIQQFLGDAVNNIVKYYYKPEREKANLTILLCGESGLATALEQIFQYGFKSSRLFVKNFYIWDYFLKVKEFFDSVLNDEFEALANAEEGDDFHEQFAALGTFCELIQKIQSYAESLGKDGKLQLFICLCAREHLLHRLPAHMSSCPITSQMYEENSFLRNPDLLSYLVQVLEVLDDFDIVLENSLTKGIE